MRHIFYTLLALFRKWFNRNPYRNPKPLRLRSVTSKPRLFLRTTNERKRKHDHMLEWCRDFNHRNGYVVPDESQRSIYEDAMRQTHAYR